MEKEEKIIETFNYKEAILAQKKYQIINKLPDFAPSDGICYRCRKQIYEPITHESTRMQGEINPVEKHTWVTGISVEKASRELITGCPHCNRTYCD